MATYGSTTKRALRYLLGENKVKDIDAGFQTLAEDVDTKLGSAGKSIIATEETRTNTSFGAMTTPDTVTGIVLPTDGLIFVAYQAMWKNSVSAQGRAAIYLGANPLTDNFGVAMSTSLGAFTVYTTLHSFPGGLGTDDGVNSDPVTTGQIVGAYLSSAPTTFKGGPLAIFAAAGTYDVSVKFRALSGSVSAKNRKLWCWVQPF